MKNIVVTGGAGFIGTNLCLRLLKQGHTVIAVDNLITSTGENLKVLQKYPNFTFIKYDINNSLKKLILQPIDMIYHLACPTGVPNVVRLAEEMILTCSLGTKNVLDLAKLKHAKVLFTGSSEAYGDPIIFPQSELYTGNVNPTGIRSPYEEGKRFSESLCVMYARKYDLDVKIVRIFNTYGPFMNLQETRVIPRMLNQLLTGQPLTVQGDGSQNRTFCYVDDLVNGFLIIMEKGESGEVYNIGNDEQITIKNLAERIIKTAGIKAKIAYIERPHHDHRGRKPDLSKIKSLGWKPEISLEEGLQLTLASLLPKKKQTSEITAIETTL